ncbi:MAG: PaaI family thioesterase [Myxococcales bacterium]|nr:PaaI family thioesterase [Myxococcales bacterium]
MTRARSDARPHLNQPGGRERASGPPAIRGRERELRRLADGVRRLVAATVANGADAAETARFADDAHALADRLEARCAAAPPPRYGGEPPDGVLEPHDVFPYDPVLGIYSPLALPVEMEYADGLAVGRARFTTPYEGPPGCVHGAIIAGAFDQVFNVANILGGAAGPTVRLDLAYERPTPLGADVVFEARIEEIGERRITTRGVLRHGDTVCVRAVGVFARIDRARVMALRS